MISIWRGFGRGIGSIIDEIVEGAGKRGLVALVVGTIAGIAITAFLVWDIYASDGCSPTLPFWGTVGRGLAALFLGFVMMTFTIIIFGLLLYVPDGIIHVAGEISTWRRVRRYRREHGLPVSDSPGTARNWIMFFGSLAIAIIALGFAVGYIAWLIVC